MRHLGSRYLNSESREFRFRFSAFASPSPPMGFILGSSSSPLAKTRRTESPTFQPMVLQPKAASAALLQALQPTSSPVVRREHLSPPFQPRVATTVLARHLDTSSWPKPHSGLWTQASPPKTALALLLFGLRLLGLWAVRLRFLLPRRSLRTPDWQSPLN